MDAWLADFMEREGLPPAFAETVNRIARPLGDLIGQRAQSPGYLVGLCGAQGSGKSTLVAVLAHALHLLGLSVATLSLDDLYLTRAERQDLARTVHPLFATRGVPGTHDVALGLRTLEALGGNGSVSLPSFDKALDDRRPASQGQLIQAPVDVILFEGWCMGARPQASEALLMPVNDLERDEDPNGVWRRRVNAELAGPYQSLFSRIDLFVLLEAPDFSVVEAWRGSQEDRLRERLGSAASGRAMSGPELARFIAHYERLTRHILAEAPARADVRIRLDRARNPTWISPPLGGDAR